MWELIDIFIALGLVAFGAVAIGALLCLDARNQGRFKERADGARGATTTEHSEVRQDLNAELREHAQVPRHSVVGTSPTQS